MAWNKIIYNDFFPLAILANAQAIDTVTILTLVEEELTNAIRFFTYHAEYT